MKYLILLLITVQIALSVEINPEKLKMDNETEYLIRLKNGDILSGYIIDVITESEKGNSLKLQTMIGNPLIYFNEINLIVEKKDYNRHKHRAFILPTAEPIGDDHFIGNFELLFFYAGFGIKDYVSVTAGRSAVPGANPGEQLSVLNLKGTFLQMDWEDYPGGLSMAAGANLAFVNDKNRIVDYYFATTFHIERTYLTASVFTKQGGDDFYTAYYRNDRFDFAYQNGSFGIALGITTKFSERHDLYFVGELWNSDIARLTNTGLLGGFRIANSTFAADFGIAFFTQPFFAPFISFVWTPF